MPATSIFSSALSSGTSGIGNSRISVLPGATRTAASTLSKGTLLDRGLRDASARLQGFTRAILEWRARGQHHRHRAHLLVRGLAPRGQSALGRQLLRRLQQLVARHDDAVVGGHQVLARAVLYGTHALLARGVLHADAFHAAEALAAPLRF